DTMRMAPPGALFLLGADEQGRDILSRLVWGGRISLLVGTAPTVIAALVGLLIGLPAAYAGGMLDLVAMRVMDILFAFPMVLLAVAVAGVLGPEHAGDRKSTRLNSSHVKISYAVFCL